jgi:MFS family permease
LKQYKKNILLLLIIQAFASLSIGWAIINVIYFINLDITFSNIGLIFALETIFISRFSIPFGYWSDTRSRKTILIISSLFAILYSFILIIFQNYYGAILWAIFSGINYSAINGPYESLLYESLKKIKKNKTNHFKSMKNKFLIAIYKIKESKGIIWFGLFDTLWLMGI